MDFSRYLPLLRSPKSLILRIIKKAPHLVSDERYLKIIYRLQMGKRLNIKEPRTYNEKLQWIKLHDRKPLYTTLVDKFAIKEYIAKKMGNEYVVPLLGVWDSPEQIDYDKLPSKFVLKTSQGGGNFGVIICQDKSSLNKDKTSHLLRKSMKVNLYKTNGEWPYKDVKPRVIAEKFLEPINQLGEGLDDYKVMCFNGKAKLIELHRSRNSANHKQDFYTRDWKLTSISQDGYIGDSYVPTNPLPKPICIDKMIELSEMLSKDIPHVRVDWYYVSGQIYFGEMTFFDGSGLEPFDNLQDDLMMGDWLDLSGVSAK